MRTFWTTVAILGLVTSGTVSGLAQTNDGQDPPPLPAKAIPLTEHAIHPPAVVGA